MDARRALVSCDLSSCSRTKEIRLEVIDFLRGVALTVVLLDHIDWFAREYGNGIFRDWMLMGLGFSDAAEVFVFLSGLTFGWVYSKKMECYGIWCVQSRVLKRSLQVYAGYMMVVAIIAMVVALGGEAFAVIAPVNGSVRTSALKESIVAAIVLAHQPFAVGILCLYVAVLPFLPVWLALFQRCSLLAFALSFVMYVAVQAFAQFDMLMLFRQWHFNPLAWQLLFVLGVAGGHWGRRGDWRLPRSGLCLLVASFVLLWGVVFKKCPQSLTDVSGLGFLVGYENLSPFVSKANLGPLRLLHFLSLAYVVASVASNHGARWSCRFVYPFVLCGKNSLPVYCVGVVLAYLSAIIFYEVGAAIVILSLVAFDACALHFLAAYMLGRRQNARRLVAR